MLRSNNIVLIGFMGSGKSTVAKVLAEKLNYKIIDTDKQIESMSGKSIPDLFATSEDYFRSWETTLLRSLKKSKDSIISTGGGMIVKEESRALLKKLGFIVYLKASEDVIFERTHNKSHRPLLDTEDPKQRIHDLLTAREPIYSSLANFSINTDNKEIGDVADLIIKEISQ